MATYAELSTIRNDDTQWGNFLAKVRVATAIKAAAVIDSATPPAEAVEWARGAIAEPGDAGNDLVWYIVAKNDSATLSQIYSASDSSIQTNINVAVDAIYGS